MIIILLLLILLAIIYYKQKKEHLTNDEAIQAVASVYNNDNMTVTNLNVTSKLNVATNASINSLAASNLNATDISANTLNLNNLNVNHNYIIDENGKYLSKSNDGNLIGIRKWRLALTGNYNRADTYYKIKDPSGREYDETNWYLEVDGAHDDPGSRGVYYPTKLFTMVNSNDNKWYLVQGYATGRSDNGNVPFTIFITAYPRKMFESARYIKFANSNNISTNITPL
jgi:hypothetical protein